MCLRGHPRPGVAKSSATYVARFAAWHFSHDPPAMWSWWKSWRKSLSRWTDARRRGGGVPTGTAKEEGHTRQVFAHAHAVEDWTFVVLLEESSRRARTRRTEAGSIWQAASRHVAPVDVVQAATKVGWRDSHESQKIAHFRNVVDLFGR